MAASSGHGAPGVVGLGFAIANLDPTPNPDPNLCRRFRSARSELWGFYDLERSGAIQREWWSVPSNST